MSQNTTPCHHCHIIIASWFNHVPKILFRSFIVTLWSQLCPQITIACHLCHTMVAIMPQNAIFLPSHYPRTMATVISPEYYSIPSSSYHSHNDIPSHHTRSCLLHYGSCKQTSQLPLTRVPRLFSFSTTAPRQGTSRWRHPGRASIGQLGESPQCSHTTAGRVLVFSFSFLLFLINFSFRSLFRHTPAVTRRFLSLLYVTSAAIMRQRGGTACLTRAPSATNNISNLFSSGDPVWPWWNKGWSIRYGRRELNNSPPSTHTLLFSYPCSLSRPLGFFRFAAILATWCCAKRIPRTFSFHFFFSAFSFLLVLESCHCFA